MEIADFHCDLLSYLAHDPSRTPHDPESHASIPFLQAGGVVLQTLAVFTETEKGSSVSGSKQVEIFSRLCCARLGFVDLDSARQSRIEASIARGPNEEDHSQIGKAFEEDQFCKVAASPNPQNLSGRSIKIGIKAVLAIENGSGFCEEGEPLEKGMERLEAWLETVGKIAYISLTWNGENRFGGGCGAKVGLKPDGREVLRWMEGKNIAIDLSHTSDRLAEEILEATQGKAITPVASHSNFRSIANHPRNLPDALAKEIGARGGVIGLNFVRVFLGAKGPADFLRQVEHAEKLGLLDHLCLGADFFAIDDHRLSELQPFFYPEFENSSCYPKVIELFTKQLPLETVEKIAHRNLTTFL